MPLIINPSLPAAHKLNITHHDPRLKIAMINLMPVKPDTELDILSLIAPLQINIAVDLLAPLSHSSRNTPAEHIQNFYKDLSAIADTTYDGIILTGAPVEHLPFEQVDYWTQIADVIDHALSAATPMLNICWGAFAAMFHLHGIEMHYRKEKLSGIFQQNLLNESPLTREFPDTFDMPHSRYAAWNDADIDCSPRLTPLATNALTGHSMITDTTGNVFINGHLEYSPLTLDKEYRRDLSKGIHPNIPANYYPGNDPDQQPIDSWHSTALKFYANWIDTLLQKKSAKDLHKS